VEAAVAAALAGPLYDPLRPWLARLSPRPDPDALAALADCHPCFVGDGRRIRFVPPQADKLAYECRVWETGVVETRPDNWHDFFNALVWLTFPAAKGALTAAHVAAMQAPGSVRGTRRDALTHFDECGIVVLSSCPELLELLRRFRWGELFVERRAEVRAAMRFVVFGHATYEALLAPFRGLTAKALLYQFAAGELASPLPELLAAVDHRLAADFASGLPASSRDFNPLPLLGIPGVTPASEEPAYYDDAWQFRPARRANRLALTAP
jgi:hypothetical protein